MKVFQNAGQIIFYDTFKQLRKTMSNLNAEDVQNIKNNNKQKYEKH